MTPSTATIWATVPVPALPTSYDPWLVAASFAVAWLAGYTALTLAGRLTVARPRSRPLWLVGGAVAMGAGIWGMHFIGMLALRVALPVTYNATIVGASIVIACGASALALHVASRTTLGARRLSAAGVALGAGIVGMHYTGMAAVRVPGFIDYIPIRVVASIVVAVAVAVVGLWLAFQFRDEDAPRQRGLARFAKPGAAAVIGVAIAGMHYTAMSAARFHGVSPTGVMLGLASAESQAANNLTADALATIVAALSILLLLAACLAALVGRRLRRAALERHAHDAEQRERQAQLERAVAERTATLQEALIAKQRLVDIIEATSDLVTIGAMPDGRCVYMNKAGRRLLQIADTESVSDLMLLQIHSDSARGELLQHALPLVQRDGIWAGESTLLARDGREIPVSMVMIRHQTADGSVPHVSAILRDESRRRALEGEIQKGRQLETVGRLAGGIAHDFNSLLSAIMSYADVLRADLRTGEARPSDVDEIRKAADRAAQLTHQLLAFSRQQVLQPRLLDANAVVRGAARTIQRTLGHGITLHLALPESVACIRVDGEQLDYVIQHLARNAQHAMGEVGRLTIETRNADVDSAYHTRRPTVPTGPYVMIAVTDTGRGMDAPTQARLFEPFFSTRDVAKRGLGLATVYGIVTQSGGFIWVYSELGRGSTFKIYFPRVEASDPSPGREASGLRLSGQGPSSATLLAPRLI